jgi:hypothetical protein
VKKLPPHPADWPDNWREAFEERAAIIEHEGRMSKKKAEYIAEWRVRLAAKSRRT